MMFCRTNFLSIFSDSCVRSLYHWIVVSLLVPISSSIGQNLLKLGLNLDQFSVSGFILPWPGDREGTLRSSSQSATWTGIFCLLVCYFNTRTCAVGNYLQMSFLKTQLLTFQCEHRTELLINHLFVLQIDNLHDELDRRRDSRSSSDSDSESDKNDLIASLREQIASLEEKLEQEAKLVFHSCFDPPFFRSWETDRSVMHRNNPDLLGRF